MGEQLPQAATYRIGRSVFRAGFGDITESKAEVLVSSDDNYLTMGGGVSPSISSAGGDAIPQHARKLIPLQQGDVAITTAGGLPAKYVFHAVTINLSPRTYPDARCIEALVVRSLDLAETLRLRSVAYPALGAGVGGFPFQQAAEIMVRTIAERLAGESSIEEVEIMLWRRSGVTQEGLNEFYQRAVALASLAVQGSRLEAAMKELEGSLSEAGREDLTREIRNVLARVRQADSVLATHPVSADHMAALEQDSGIAGIGRDALAAVDNVRSLNHAQDRSVEARALETRLEGLTTLLNVHYGSLNKLEIDKARYGGRDVPVILENQIEQVTNDVSQVEESIRETRKRIATLAATVVR